LNRTTNRASHGTGTMQFIAIEVFQGRERGPA
jgi:hypothetical protein